MELKIGISEDRISGEKARLVVKQLMGAGISANLISVNELRGLELLEAGKVDCVLYDASKLPILVSNSQTVIAYLKREDPREVLLAVREEIDVDNFSRPWKIGVSTGLRKALVSYYFNHLEIEDLVGTADSWFESLESGMCDGILMAYADVKRLGWMANIVRKMNPHAITPSIGQGIDAMVCLEDFVNADRIYSLFNHAATEVAFHAEVAFSRAIPATTGGHVFGLATVLGPSVHLHGGWISADAKEMVRHSLDGSSIQAKNVGEQLAKQIIEKVKQSKAT